MTRDETKQLLMMVQAAFPNYKPQDKTIAINTWYRMLEKYENEQIVNAFMLFVQTETSGFPPSVGQIIEKVYMLEADGDLNPMDAWALVRKAISRSGYYSEEEFRKLPPVVQKAVGSAGQLRVWALDEGYNESVISSNFMRVYRMEAEAEKEMKKCSQNIGRLMRDPDKKMGIEQKQFRELSVSEEREATEQNAVPMPQGLREKLRRKLA